MPTVNNTAALYPVRRPRADTSFALISNTVLQAAMVKLQHKRMVGTGPRAVADYFFRKQDIDAAATTLTGPAKLAVNNLQRYFDAHPGVTEVSRDAMMSFADAEVRTQLIAAAGTDGKLTGKEPNKLPAWVRDDFDFITTGTLK